MNAMRVTSDSTGLQITRERPCFERIIAVQHQARPDHGKESAFQIEHGGAVRRVAHRHRDAFRIERALKRLKTVQLPRRKLLVLQIRIGKMRHQTLYLNTVEPPQVPDKPRRVIRRNTDPAHAGIDFHMHGNPGCTVFAPRLTMPLPQKE